MSYESEPTEAEATPEPEVAPTVVHVGGAIPAEPGAAPPVTLAELAERMAALEQRVAALE